MTMDRIKTRARKLGVWWDGRPAAKPWRHGEWALTSTGDDLAVVFADGRRTAVDRPTAALLLLGHERGLVVDCGRCPACRERGGGHIWSQRERRAWSTGPGRWLAKRGPGGGRVRRAKLRTWSAKSGLPMTMTRPRRAREIVSRWVCAEVCPQCAEPGEPVPCANSDAVYLVGRHVVRDSQRRWDVCPDCKGRGKVPGEPQPTGRARRPWVQAVLDARHMVGRPWLAWRDRALLDALTVLADDLMRRPAWISLGTHATTYDTADAARRDAKIMAKVVRRRANRFEPTETPAGRWCLTEFRADPLGLWVSLFLRGECEACKGSGLIGGPVNPTYDRRPDRGLCPRCHSYGSTLGTAWPQLEQALGDEQKYLAPRRVTP